MTFIALVSVFAIYSCEKSQHASASTPSSESGKTESSPSADYPNVLQLKISDDGKAILDDKGKVIATFAEDITVKTAITKTSAAGSPAIPGCMCCEQVCMAYEGEKCVKWVQSCTWDFDCKCKK